MSLSFQNKTSQDTFSPQAHTIAQFVVDEVNRRDLADSDFESREFGEFDDSHESREFGRDVDGYYQLVKVHKVSPMVSIVIKN